MASARRHFSTTTPTLNRLTSPLPTTVTTNAQGKACLGGLVLSGFVGNYTVHETEPAGYQGEADKSVTVDTNASCTGDPYAGESVSFHNTPLTDVTVSVDSLVDGGTASTIRCVDGSGALVVEDNTFTPGDTSVTAEDLLPTAPGTTLVCTIVVDP